MVGSVFCPLLNTDSLSDAFRYLNWMQAGASEVRDHMLLAQALFKTQLKANTIPPIRDILCFSIRTKYLEGSRPMRVHHSGLLMSDRRVFWKIISLNFSDVELCIILPCSVMLNDISGSPSVLLWSPHETELAVHVLPVPVGRFTMGNLQLFMWRSLGRDNSNIWTW